MGAHLDVRCGVHSGDHSVHDGQARTVAPDPRHARPGMSGFKVLNEGAIRPAVKRRSQSRQRANGPRALPGQDSDGFGVAKTAARSQGVRRVQCGIIIFTQGRGDTALGPGRGAVLPERAGSQHKHPPWGGGERRGKPGQAGADHKHAIEGKAVGHQSNATST